MVTVSGRAVRGKKSGTARFYRSDNDPVSFSTYGVRAGRRDFFIPAGRSDRRGRTPLWLHWTKFFMHH